MAGSRKNHAGLIVLLFSIVGISMFVTPAYASCGPYADVVVTGTTKGVVWGSGPYGQQSDFNTAAVHAGLIEPNETVTIRRTSVGARTLTDSVRNGVSSSAFAQSMCAVTLSVVDGASSSASQSGSATTSASTGTTSGNGPTAACPTYPDILVTGISGRQQHGTENKVFGTGTYAQTTVVDDLGRAAVHAGIIEKDEKAIVRRTSVGIVESFDDSTAHNVVSQSAPSGCGYSLSVVSKVSARSVSSCTPYKELTVKGTKSGEVWGDAQYYTDNSNMGVAAVHAGLIQEGEIGGVVLRLYGGVSKGTGVPVARNGVTPGVAANSGATCLYTIENYNMFPLRSITENISFTNLDARRTKGYLEQSYRVGMYFWKEGRIPRLDGPTQELHEAIKEYQYEKGIARSGDEGYGEVGPKTRAAINAGIDVFNARAGIVVNNFMNGTNTIPEANVVRTPETNNPRANSTIEELLARIQELERQIAALTGTGAATDTNTNSNPGAGSVEVSDIRIGDQVETTERVHVRTTPSPEGFSWGTVEPGRVGIVYEGPKGSGGFMWWKVQFIGKYYDNENPFGWVAGKYLRLTDDSRNSRNGSDGSRNSGESGGSQPSAAAGEVIVGKITNIDAPGSVYFGTSFTAAVTMKNTTAKKGVTRANISITTYPQLNVSITNGGYFEEELAPGESSTKSFQITITHSSLNPTKVPAWDGAITSSTHWDTQGAYSNFSENIRVLPAAAPSSDKEVFSSRLGKYVSCGEYPSEEGCACTGPAGQSLSWNPFSTASVACSVYIGGIKIPYGISYLTNINSGFTGRGAVQCKDTGIVTLVKEQSTCTAN